MKYILYFILFVGLVFSGYFLWLQYKYNKTGTLTGISCPQLQDRYGVNVEDFVAEMNKESKPAQVLQGYRQISGEVTSNADKNLFLNVGINNGGKITSFVCRNTKIYVKIDKSQDVIITMPEPDFGNLVKSYNNLQESQAASYMMNITTDPTSAKKTIIQRITN